MPLLRIIYTSTAHPDLTNQDVRQLVNKSQKNNEFRKLTGLLLCGHNIFLQILEGEEQIVRSLITKIRKDKRHHDMEVLSECPIKSRSFKKWLSANMEMEELPCEEKEEFMDLTLFQDAIEPSTLFENAEGKMLKACLNLARH